jgi:transposase
MPRNKALSSETRQSILVLRNEGYSMREIAKKLKISYNTVYYFLHRTVQTGSNQNRKRSGRPRCTNEREDKYIRVSSLRNRCLTSPQLAASLNSTYKTPVSTSTVKRQLRDAGLLGRVSLSSVCVLLPILIFYFYWPVWDMDFSLQLCLYRYSITNQPFSATIVIYNINNIYTVFLINLMLI